MLPSVHCEGCHQYDNFWQVAAFELNLGASAGESIWKPNQLENHVRVHFLPLTFPLKMTNILTNGKRVGENGSGQTEDTLLRESVKTGDSGGKAYKMNRTAAFELHNPKWSPPSQQAQAFTK